MNRYSLASLSVISGIITGLAWTSLGTSLLMLISFVPFFLIAFHIHENKKRYTPNAFFLYLLPGFVIFCILAMGWVRVASIPAAITIILGLSFLMSFTLWLSYLVWTRAGKIAGFISVLAFWCLYEYLNLHINILTPWLNLGNGLAKDIAFIQWYEVTGTAGGSVWILLSNLLLGISITSFHTNSHAKFTLLITWILIIIIPSAISLYRYHTIKENGSKCSEIVIIQPNVDPYTQKFMIPFDKQLNRVLTIAAEKTNSRTSWIVTPETTIDDPVNLQSMLNDKYVSDIRQFLKNYPQASFVTGMVSYRSYPEAKGIPSKSARKDASGLFRDYYNSAFRIDTGRNIEVYHKSKLVPGIEMQFLYGPGRLISRLLPGLGGTEWGYGIQDKRKVFTNPATGDKAAPVICYESIFGEYVTEYVRKGAELIFIITNDGWWKETYGYRQHLNFASLRAIETRRPVARSANTGISCFIDIRGKRIIESNWWDEEALSGCITPENTMTPYVRYGDYLLRIGSLTAVVMLIIVFVSIPLKKKFREIQ
jgi:apolipoprotein N-acyltransferase